MWSALWDALWEIVLPGLAALAMCLWDWWVC